MDIRETYTAYSVTQINDAPIVIPVEGGNE